MNVSNAICGTPSLYNILGILNTTPDSFYDGGRYNQTDVAVQKALRLIEEGADILDIGGASSRPGASQIDVDEEIRRVVPVISAVRKASSIPLSIDTCWSAVAKAAIDAGASWINDISAGRFDSKMPHVAANAKARVILMHSRGTPQTMHNETLYVDIVNDLKAELLQSVALFVNAGVPKEHVVVDPGIGFSKTFNQNCEILKHIKELCALGYPVLLGTSRKSFIGTITGRPVEERLAGSLGSIAAAYLSGVRLFRVHDVAATRDFLAVLSELNT